MPNSKQSKPQRHKRALFLCNHADGHKTEYADRRKMEDIFMTKPMNLQLFAEGAATPPPAGDPGTPPQAGTVDIDAIVSQASTKATEAAEKKMQAVFKSMLQQEGLDAETIKSVTDDWKTKNKHADPPKTEESAEHKALLERLGALEAVSKQAQAELTERKQQDFLREAKIPEEQLDFYQFKIKKLVTDALGFEDAAAQYIKDNPPQVRPPEFATGSGKPMATATEKEQLLNEYKAAQKNKNHAEMSRLTRLAHQKGIQLF